MLLGTEGSLAAKGCWLARRRVPLQREAVGELIADLIFDCDCPGAELVLCLPLQAASWCVVHGYGSDGSPDLLPHALQSVDLPFELAESYVTSAPRKEAPLRLVNCRLLFFKSEPSSRACPMLAR